ncbi:hypothetical protein RJ639_022167, partial [Escallonia herrerae]
TYFHCRNVSTDILILSDLKCQVQNLIERCLQLYMSQKEVVNTLLQQAKIEPGFTELGKFYLLLHPFSMAQFYHLSFRLVLHYRVPCIYVWQKLEEENQDFFKAYHLRLIVKEQISKFNRLLERQFELMQQICPTGVTSISMPNGSHIPPKYVRVDNTQHY